MKPNSRLAAFCALPAMVFGLMGAAQAGIKDGLVAHLTFDNTYVGALGNGVDGTPVGEPAFVPGTIGAGSVSLTSDAAAGVFNYVTLGTPELLNFGSVTDGNAVDFSISFWCNYTDQTSDPVFIATQNWDSSNNQGWGLYMQGGGASRVVITDNRGSAGKVDLRPSPVTRDGTWHNYVVTFARAGAATVYIDGALATSANMSAVVTGSVDNGLPVNIGQDGTGAYDAHLVGLKMDDLGIWRRALAAGEVAAIYNAGKSGKNLQQVPEINDPYVQSTTPGAGATGVRPDTTITAVIVDGLTQLKASSVQLTVNGTTVPITITKVNNQSTVTSTLAGLLPSGVSTAVLVFSNDANPPVSVTQTWSFTSTYATLTADLKVTPDTSKPGFVWNIFANVANVVNSNDRTDNALAGQLVDANGAPLPNLANPDAQGAAIAASTAPNPENAPIKFEIASVINLSRAGGDSFGNFTPDEQMPGVPATDNGTDGLAAEILTYLELPAGLTIMGVNSDDGFRTTAGLPLDVFKSIFVGEYSGGRGAGDTLFMVVAQQAGVYAFRTSYENGGGDGNVEWFTVKSDGTKVLVNDLAQGGIKAYRAATTPVAPYVKTVKPQAIPRQAHETSSTLTIVLADGDGSVNDSSIVLKLDGKAVTPTKSRQGKTVTITYAPTTLQVPSQHYGAELTFKDGTGASHTQSWQFYNLKNIVLPAPLVTENFDSYDEGKAPTGWNAWNFTDCSGDYCANPGEDIGNLNSDTFKGWVAMTRDQLASLKARIFNAAPGETFNGKPVTVDDLSTGSLLYAESDVRDGNQVQFIISKPFNLSQINNVVLTFASLYEQNQDNIGAVEYSVDGGATWLPVVYFIDYLDTGGDIKLNADGSVDAVATLTGANGDTAVWMDNGVSKGGKYGDGIAAPISAALGAYIVPRANDDPVSDKRFEVFRLPQAGKKADVRLRFAQLGTASWYFALDNIAFYEDPNPPATEGAKLAIGMTSATSVTISWTGPGTLYEASKVTGNWAPAASQANPQTVPTTGAEKYYRVY